MEYSKNGQKNVQWSDLFTAIKVPYESRKQARKALRDGDAKFSESELILLKKSNFFSNWYKTNKTAIAGNCSTSTVSYFESIVNNTTK